MSVVDDFAWRNIHIGPSPEYQARQQEEALNREGERLVRAVEAGRVRRAALHTKYGTDLVDYAIAYNSRHKPGQHGLVHLQMGMIEVQEIRKLYVEELIHTLSAMSEDKRAAWLHEFLVDIDREY